MNAILALQVDGHDTTPVGVYFDVAAARDAILEEEESRGREPEDFALDRETFLANLNEELENARRETELGIRFDIQFESGFGSFDYRLVEVEVHI